MRGINNSMSFGVQMREDVASLLRTSNHSGLFPLDTVLFFGFSKGDKDSNYPREFESACERYGIRYERLCFVRTNCWLYGECYTIAIESKEDFEKVAPVIEAFGGSTERYLLKSADVRLAVMDEIVSEHERMVLLEKSIKGYFGGAIDFLHNPQNG